jgi:hypothetical protein
MKNIRNKVFETNSSSTHSVSIVSNVSGIYDSIIPDNGIITLTGGLFGWEWEKYNDATTKANYAAVFCQDHPQEVEMLNEVLKEQTGAKDIYWDLRDSNIDHQSSWSEDGEAKTIFQSKEILKNWIFNPSCWLYTGNDNSDADCEFYNHPESKYTHFLKVENTNLVTKFLGYPETSEIKKSLKLMTYKLSDQNISYSNYRIFDPNFNKSKDLDGKELNSFSLIEHGICILYDADFVIGYKIPTYKVNSIENIKFTIDKIKDEPNSS